jgi:hypothetical protein
LLKICTSTGRQEKYLHLKKSSWLKHLRAKHLLLRRRPMEALHQARLPAKFLLHSWLEARLHLPKPAQTKAELRKLAHVV